MKNLHDISPEKQNYVKIKFNATTLGFSNLNNAISDMTITLNNFNLLTNNIYVGSGTSTDVYYTSPEQYNQLYWRPLNVRVTDGL